jgi:molybdenum cofactor cytidylyltransferase
VREPAILLAAGASRRLGQPKQLVHSGGQSLLRRSARAALGACAPVLVVVGHQGERMAEELAGLPVTLVPNPGWEEGMAASIRAGILALPPDAEGALFLVCDQVAVSAAVVGDLLALRRLHPEAVVTCGYGGGRGIPSWFPRARFPELLALRGDRGARSLLEEAGVVVLPFPEGAEDVDLPEDLERLRG